MEWIDENGIKNNITNALKRFELDGIHTNLVMGARTSSTLSKYGPANFAKKGDRRITKVKLKKGNRNKKSPNRSWNGPYSG